MPAKRRWFQFSLRTLVVLTLLVSVVLGCWGYARRRAQRQWEAVRAIREAGGWFLGESFREGGADVSVADSMRSEATTWQQWLGIDVPLCNALIVPENYEHGEAIAFHVSQLRQLEVVDLRCNWVDDEFMKMLSRFPQLNHLDIDSDKITDAGVLCFAGNNNIQHLDLSGELLTDRGMAVVAQLPQLRSFTWDSPNTTGEGLAHLRNHPQLHRVRFHGATVSDVWFEHLSTCARLEGITVVSPNTLTSQGVGALARVKLQNLAFFRSPLSKDAVSALSNLTKLKSLKLTGPLSAEDLSLLSSVVSLESLTLGDCKLTSEGLKNLAPLKQLYDLNVDMAGLGDEDMEHLAKYANLGHVDLSHSAVTDAGLMKLVGMKQLFGVYIEGSKITAEGVKEFKRLAPNVDVEGDPGN